MSRFFTRLFPVLVLMLLAAISSSARCDDLNLTDQQRSQLKTLGNDIRKETSDLRLKLFDRRKELMNLYSSYNLDEKKARSQIRRINSVQLALLNIGLEDQLRLRKIVSTEQFKVISKMQHDRMGKFRDKMGRSEGRHTMGHMHDMGRVFENTDVTPAQKDRLHKLYDRTSTGKGKGVPEIIEASKNLERLFSSYDLNESQARAAIKRLNKAQLDMMMSHLERQEELRKILNEDQFTAVKAKLVGRHDKAD